MLLFAKLARLLNWFQADNLQKRTHYSLTHRLSTKICQKNKAHAIIFHSKPGRLKDLTWGQDLRKFAKEVVFHFFQLTKKHQRTSWMQLKRVWNIRVFFRTMPNLGQFQFWLWEVMTKMSEKNSNSPKIPFLNLFNWKRIQNFLILTKIQKAKHRSVIVMVTWKVGHF